MYNVNYRQSATASPHLPIHDSQTILDGIMPGQPNHPYLPIHVMRNIEDCNKIPQMHMYMP
jgi:hypothetical protein